MHSPKLAPLHQAAQVHYRASVIDAATGRTVRRLRRKKNLILDQGMNGLAVRTWAASFTHAVIGTATTPTKRDSGAVTVSQAGTTLTASAGFFEADDVGRLFKFDTGEEVRITVFTSGTSVEVSTSATIAAAEGTVWYVNQTALTTEVKRTATYGSESGDNGSTYATGTWTHKRTFIFSAEAGTVNYREIGWSHTATVGANLFGRDLLAGSGVTLVAGQQLKVVVELTVSYAPVTATAWVTPITGWTQNGQHGIEDIRVDQVAGTGGATGWQSLLDPSLASASFSLATHTNAIRDAAASNQDIVGGTFATSAVGRSAYTAGTFTVSYSPQWAVGAGNGAWRSLATGGNGGGGQLRTQYRVRLDADETKDSDHTLTLTFTISWGRILTN